MSRRTRFVLAAVVGVWSVIAGKAIYQAPTVETIEGAVWYFNKGRHDTSLRSFKDLLEKNPKDQIAKFWLARHYLEGLGTAQDLDKAIAMYGELSDAGMSAAPVWVATALERRGRSGDLVTAMANYKASLDRGPYAGSALRLAQGHTNGTGVDIDHLKALRYLARAHILKAAGINPQPYRCATFIRALRYEKAVAKMIAGAEKTKPLDKERFKLRDCIRNADKKDWKQRAFRKLVDYAKLTLVPGGSYAPKEPTDMQQSPGAVVGGAEADIVPPGFSMTFSIASDADSQSYAHAIANQTIIQQDFGLPISTSTFVTGLGLAPTSSFFAGQINPRSLPFGQAKSELSDSLRLWHKGWVDHIHGWSDIRLLATHRFARPKPLSRGIDINISTLFALDNAKYQGIGRLSIPGSGLSFWSAQKFGVLRLMFDKLPPRDTVYIIDWPPFIHSYDVNAWKLFTRKVKEKGRDVFVVELPISASNANSYHRVTRGEAVKGPPGTGARVEIAAKSCNKEKCATGHKANLLSVELDPLSRNGIAAQAEWLKYFNVRPIINTAHGGERPASFATAAYVDQMRKLDKNADKLRDKTYVWLGLPIAALPGGKGYVQDILEDLGIRAVRPFQMKSGPVMLQFGDPAPLSAEFGNMANLVTAWAGMTDTSYPDKDKFLKWATSKMHLSDATARKVWKVRKCGFEQGGWLAGIIEGSLRTKFAGRKSGEIWYTHFATICDDPTRTKGSIAFSKMGQDALSKLSQLHYGLGGELEAQGYQRLWVLPPSAALRHRILDAELSSGNLEIEKTTDHVKIEPTTGLYLPETFPRPGLETRDLHGLTFKIKDRDAVSRTKISVANKELKWLVKQAPKGADAGYITVLDTSAAYPVLDEIPWPATSGQPLKSIPIKSTGRGGRLSFEIASGAEPSCLRPDLPGTLDNISAVGLSLRGVAADASLAIEFKTARHGGSIVVTNRYVKVKDRLKHPEHSVLDFDLAHSTPDKQWRNYLIPTYNVRTQLAQPIKSMADVPLLQGRLRQVCIHYQSGSGKPLQIDQLKLYRYVTANRLPTDPLVVAGVVKAGKDTAQDSGKTRFVKITGKSGKPIFAHVGADGFYLAKIDDGAQVVTVELLGGAKGSQTIVGLRKRMVHLVKAEAHVDFDLGAAQ